MDGKNTRPAAGKTGWKRVLEIILLYVLLPGALIALFLIGLRPLLLSRRPPASAWWLTGAGAVLAIGWAVWFLVRKKPVTPGGCILAAVVVFYITSPLLASLPDRHPAYLPFAVAAVVSLLLFLGAVVWWLVKSPKVRDFLLRYVGSTLLHLLLMYLLMTSVTELIYGKTNTNTFLRLAAAAGIVLLVYLPGIIRHFRKKSG